MSAYAGNTETGTLLHRHGIGYWNRLLQRNDGIFSGGAKRTVALSPITPHTPSKPFLRYAFADRINRPGTIAVWNDTRIWHPNSKGILTLFNITRIDA